MNNRSLGTLAIAGAPFLFIGTLAESLFKSLSDSWFTGVWGLIYITAWTGTTVALIRLKAAGTTHFGKIILWVLIGTLTVANISNIYQLLVPDSKPFFFFYIDLFWPLSNIILLVAGITILRAKRLTGWRRYVPFAAGLWLPFALSMLAVLGRTPTSFFIGGLYSAIAWTLLALVVRTTGKPGTTPVMI